MPGPRIGITCSGLRPPDYTDPYLRALEAAGATVVRLTPPGSDIGEQAHLQLPPGSGTGEQARFRLLRELEALLLPGGWDIEPQVYGEAPGSVGDQIDPALDRIEIALTRSAARVGVPVFGICRGQQMVNVALGGTLHQHVDGHDLHHRPRNSLAHPVAVEPGSKLARVTGPGPLMVNSLHHQAVKAVAPGLRVNARAPDGVVEGLESADGLIVTVQCHPEELTAEHAWARALFTAFVDRAGGRSRTGRASA